MTTINLPSFSGACTRYAGVCRTTLGNQAYDTLDQAAQPPTSRDSSESSTGQISCLQDTWNFLYWGQSNLDHPAEWPKPGFRTRSKTRSSLKFLQSGTRKFAQFTFWDWPRSEEFRDKSVNHGEECQESSTLYCNRFQDRKCLSRNVHPKCGLDGLA